MVSVPGIKDVMGAVRRAFSPQPDNEIHFEYQFEEKSILKSDFNHLGRPLRQMDFLRV